MSRTAAILLAAGRSRRMRGAVADKILAPLAGRPVFAHSAAAFAASGVADFYVVVVRDSRQSLALSRHAPTPALYVRGGRARQDSVANALAALPDDVDCVFIHDCARPLVEPGQLRELLRGARRYGAAVLAHRVVDTIKRLTEPRGRQSGACRARTLERDGLWAMETPQVFARDLIVRAYARVRRLKLAVTDDAQAVELLGRPILFIENPHPNPKLTAPGDLAWIETLSPPRALAAVPAGLFTGLLRRPDTPGIAEAAYSR